MDANIVRTAAVLHLGSPRSSDARGTSDGVLATPDIRLGFRFSAFGLPAIDGELVRKYLDMESDPIKDQEKAACTASGKDAQCPTEGKLTASQRLEAVLKALERTYEAPSGVTKSNSDLLATSASSVKTGDGWCSLLPDGPYAVAVITGQKPWLPNTYSDADSSVSESAGACSPGSDATAPFPAAVFPPLWLPALSRSLTYLDLSYSLDLDPATWDIPALAALPRLALLCLRNTVLVSPLPAALVTRLPALRVLDLHNAKFTLPQEQVAAMLLALSNACEVCGTGGAIPARHVVLTTSEINDREMKMQSTFQGTYISGTGPELRLRYVPSKDPEASDGGGSDSVPRIYDTPTDDGKMFSYAAAIRAVQATRERAFLAHARAAWWEISLEEGSKLVRQPLDFSMLQLLYDLGLLPPLAEPQQPPSAGSGIPASATGDTSGASGAGQEQTAGQVASIDNDFGVEFVIKDWMPDRPPGVELTIDYTCLELSWPYKCSRWDSPTWSHEQSLHSLYRKYSSAYLTSRQWKLFIEGATHGSESRLPATGASGQDADDPFAVEVVPFQALEDRERLAAATLYAACKGTAKGMMSVGDRFKGSVHMVSEHEAIAASKSRPQPGASVVVPTASALAARSRARRLLVAGLLGAGLEAVSPAPHGIVSPACLLLAMRLEARLYGRVRRVSILPRSNPAYSVTHVTRYWSSVQSLHDLLRTVPLVRRGVLGGSVPLAAAAELPAAELRALVYKMDKAARKGIGGAAAALAEKALLAADTADLDALENQASNGGRIDEQIPLFTEDWQPSERGTESLCAWYIADPYVWPHGTVLHNAVALGHLRAASWLLERGVSINSRISRWGFSPVHLCCLRPCIWPIDYLILRNFRIPATPRDSYSTGTGTNSTDVKDREPDRNPDDDSSDEDESHAQQSARLRRMDVMMSWQSKLLDKKLGVPKGFYKRAKARIFPGVCAVTEAGFTSYCPHRCNVMMGPLWFSVDDEVNPTKDVPHGQIQKPFVRSLVCTAATSAAHDDAGGASAMAAAAHPMLRLLLSHGADLNAQSWCGMTPLHCAAASCAPETFVALVEAGASLRTRLPGTLVGPLHLLAHRSTRRWSGITPRAAARVLSCQPIIPAEEVLIRWDEWRGCPLFWLMADKNNYPPTSVLGPLLESLRNSMGFGPPGKSGAGSCMRPDSSSVALLDNPGPRLTGSGVNRNAELLNVAVYGVARALCSAIVSELADHVRMLVQYFPEAVTVLLPPADVTPLHIACYMVAWNDVKRGHILRCSVYGDTFEGNMRLPKAMLEKYTPHVPPGITISTIVPTRASTGGGSSGSPTKELLVLEKEPPAASGQARKEPMPEASAPASTDADERWHYCVYTVIVRGPVVNEGAGETESSAMQRCLNAQLQIVHLLLGAGALVDVQDAFGYTPLIVAILSSSPPVVALLLEKGASMEVVARHAIAAMELFTGRRLGKVRTARDSQVLGPDLLLFGSCEALQGLGKQQIQSAKKDEEKRDSEDEDGDEDEDEDEDAGSGKGKGKSGSGRTPAWKRPRYGAMGDDLLALPSIPVDLFKELMDKTLVTPLTAAVMRYMICYTCSRHYDETGPGTGMKVDGTTSSYHFTLDNSMNIATRLSRFGDGILYLLLHHGSPELRKPLLDIIREATASNVVEEMPRTSIWLLQEAMPGNHYVSYADRAAREACNTLSPFTLTSLDSAIQKALNLALKEAGLVGRDPHKRAEEKAKAAEVLGSGAPPWGPYEDEILGDLITTGLYPLFMSRNVTNGEASILRMSAGLLQFANRISVCKRALLQAHIRQFTRDGLAHGGDSGNASSPAAAWDLDNIEHLPVESFNYACKSSQQRIRATRALGLSAHAGADGGTTAVGDATTSQDNKNGSTVLALHTLDDIEYGLTYSRANEVLPPVTSMRMSLGHNAPIPDVVLRALAETMFKFVRTLCHVAQKELQWVRLPGGVTYTAVDGLFLPMLPGERGWNVTDMFRPRNFGFRLSFTYTRRTLTVELHAMSLMRTVPIDIEDLDKGDAASGTAIAATSPLAGGRVAMEEAPSTAGAAATGTDGSGDTVQARRAGAASVTHSRAAEFGYWMRNPDVVRMEQVQSMAGRLESTARRVGGNWRQMPAPPPWWITGWVDRFFRLFLLEALNNEGNKAKKLKLVNMYDTSAQDPRVPNSDAAAPWSRLEANVLMMLLSLHPLSLDGKTDGESKDLGGNLMDAKHLNRVEKILKAPICASISRMTEDSNPDRGCIAFTAQWNMLAQERKWPMRSTLEIQDVIFRLVRMSSCSYTAAWLPSLQVMFEMLMSGDISPELRRETEAKLLSLASDATFARRLVWGTCRGRRADARALALLSGVVEFQPLLMEALMEHEAECEALEQWSQESQYWVVACGPALEKLEPEGLSMLLQEHYDFDYRPLVLPYRPVIAAQSNAVPRGATGKDGAPVSVNGAATTIPTAGEDSGDSSKRMVYCRFRSREDLSRAVSAAIPVPGLNGKGSGMGPSTSSLLAMLPISLWEAGAVTSSEVPHRHDKAVLPFFSLVFSRLPRGLQRADPHAAGTMWGAGLQAVVLHRRPGLSRWYPWGSPPDVSEEAGVAGTLFDAHATEPLPKSWMRELDSNDDGELTYREFLLAYLRHRGGDFLGPQLQPEANAALQQSGDRQQVTPGAGAQMEGNATADQVMDPEPSAVSAGTRGWQRATRAVAQGQLSQAFWDQANALQLLRNRDREAAVAGRQNALMRAERDQQGPAAGAGSRGGGRKAPTGPGAGNGTGIAAMRQLRARALGALAGSLLGPGGSSSSFPLVTLAGLDTVTPEELSEVQRCAWITYGNMRTAARYLQNAQANGYVPDGSKAGSTGWLTAWQAAERAAIDSVMRGLHKPGALFDNQAAAAALGGGAGLFGPRGPRSWLQALSGTLNPGPASGAAGTMSDGTSACGRSQVRDSILLELIVDLAASSRRAAHGEVLSEGDEKPVGPMVGPSPMFMGRTLASVAAQLGVDSAEEVATAVGALALSIKNEGASRGGAAPGVGGLDEMFCASALRLAAEEVWAFVMDMQAMVDQVVSPLVAAADQSMPIIERESINTIFGNTNIELILEYEIELLKLLTVQWRMGARTSLVIPSVAGPSQYLVGSMQKKLAAARLRAFGGDFPPSAEQLGLDPLATGVQLRPVLTDPGVAGEVLELLLRLATAYQNYLDRIDEALQELLACVDRDEKGTLSALLRRFGRPVKLRTGEGAKAKVGDPSTEDAAKGEEEDSDSSSDYEDATIDGDGKNAGTNADGAVASASASKGSGGQNDGASKAKPKDDKKDKGTKKDKRLSHPPIHHVRPLISIRQLARYGAGAEVEACLRKPASHLAVLAFLANVCRSISQAQGQLAAVQAAVAGGDGGTGEPGQPPTLAMQLAPAVAIGAAYRRNAAAAGASSSFKFRFGFGKAAAVGSGTRAPSAPPSAGAVNTRRSSEARSGGAVMGALRRVWQWVLGVRMSKVLPLGADLHPLFQPPAPGPGGIPRASAASTAEHRVTLRAVGAAVMAAEEGGRRLGPAPSMAERLDVWMEQKLLAGNYASRILLVVCTALTCLMWRVVPLVSEWRRYLEDLRVANNLLHHRHVIRQLERAINVRPDDDDALDAEVAELHSAIRRGVEDAAKEVDMGDGDVDKMSPMILDSSFWTTKGPKRIHDPEPLWAALKLAEERTLHSTFAGARLLSNARRCAARLAAANAGMGSGKGTKSGAAGKGARKGGASKSHGVESDSDEAEMALDAIAVPAPAKRRPPPPPPKKTSAVVASNGAKGIAGPGTGPVGAKQLVRLFGSKPREGAAGDGPKMAWGMPFGGGGIAAAVGLAQRVKQFGGALKRAVRRREHARRRWDKTLFLVTQSGALDEANLVQEHAREVSRLQRAAALLAWKQLRGAAGDILMVFGAVVFRDVGRAFALVMSGFLMAFPFAVLAVALQMEPDTLPDRRWMAGLVAAYVVIGFCGMAAAVAQLRKDPSQLKVYKPSDTIRFPNFRKGTTLSSWKAHWVNVFALFTLVLEFWQLCAFSYQRRIPYPKASFLKQIFPWALLDLGPAAYFLQVFALLAFMLVWIAVFFPQTPAGLKRVIMPFLGQASYLTITSGLLSQLDCRLESGQLVRNQNITCWIDPRHLYGAVAAMLALGLYVPRATLTPFEVFFPSENLDIKYRGLYVRVVQLLRLGMAGYNLFFLETYPLAVMLANAILCGLLAAMTAIMWPCCIGAVNIGRGTGFVLATWSQVVSVVVLNFIPDNHLIFDPIKRQYYTDDWKYVYVLVSGWVIIAAVGYWLLKRYLRRSGSAAIRFSLKTNPFNYTLSPSASALLEAAPASASTWGQQASETIASDKQQAPQLAQRPPPPPGTDSKPPASRTSDERSLSGLNNMNEEASGSDAATATRGTYSSIASSGEGREEASTGDLNVSKGDSDSDDDKEEDKDGPGRRGSSGNSERDDSGSAADGGSKGERSSDPPSNQPSISNSALDAALGLPVVSPRLISELAHQGLLTPADEMRAFMARLVRRARRRLAGNNSSDSDEDRFDRSRHRESDDEEDD
ncbi:hypothetical protein VaNZ11_011934 [Volvox africanus]|uniref:Uncharacterized protein n=1 Tax=Volvox africanus TaxID=51714 RepID=A0ABQ5SE56_9CHLO|nr:hypothetical protein VaNZ11_011934 [Volvox africanus]